MPIFNKLKATSLELHADLNLEDLDAVKYHKIGLAVDFSGMESQLISAALSFGNKDTTYYLVHIVESATARLWSETSEDAETKQDIIKLKQIKKYLEEKGFKAEINLGYGKPSAAISKISYTHKFDLLIVGSHGHQWFKDIIFGETINKLRHLVKTPVFIVK